MRLHRRGRFFASSSQATPQDLRLRARRQRQRNAARAFDRCTGRARFAAPLASLEQGSAPRVEAAPVLGASCTRTALLVIPKLLRSLPPNVKPVGLTVGDELARPLPVANVALEQQALAAIVSDAQAR